MDSERVEIIKDLAFGTGLDLDTGEIQDVLIFFVLVQRNIGIVDCEQPVWFVMRGEMCLGKWMNPHFAKFKRLARWVLFGWQLFVDGNPRHQTSASNSF